MKIVTDTASNLTPERASELGVEVVPFRITYMGKTYLDGVDLSPAGLYELFNHHPNEFAVTSQPSPGDYQAVYEKYPGEEIVSIQLSSGLSGSYNSAVTAVQSMATDLVSVVDSLMIGPAQSWMVEVAALGARKGWSRERIVAAVKQVKEATFTTVGFTDISHLVHSGRVSHIRGIMASILKIKPMIGMDPVIGCFSPLGQSRSVEGVARRMADLTFQKIGAQKTRLQLMHGTNLPAVETLRSALMGVVDSVEEEVARITTVIGAHAGPTCFGLAAAPTALFTSLLG
jgi:DegV family protein with EDD domain